MTTEWAFAFLNTNILIFCLIYSLGNQNPSFSLLKAQYVYFKIDISATFHYKKLFWHFFSCDITNVTADINIYVVYRFQPLKLNSAEYLRFTNCYEKANKKRRSWHSKTIGHWLFASESIENLFYLHAAIFEVPK